MKCICFVLMAAVATAQQMLVFEDNFDTLDVTKWEHELTLGGGGVSNYPADT